MSMKNIINRLKLVTKANELIRELLKLDKSIIIETDFASRNKLMAKLEESIVE